MTVAIAEAVIHRCNGCGVTRAKPALPRIPKGWKRREKDIFCIDCWVRNEPNVSIRPVPARTRIP